MKKYIETIMTVVITFIISLVLNSVSTYITQDQGTVKIGSTIKVNNQEYLPLDIETYSNKATDGLLFAIPSATSVAEIISSHPLNIKTIPAAIGASDIKYIKASDIEPNTTVQLLIPINNQQDTSLIRLTNQEQFRFSVVYKDEVQSPLKTAIQEALKLALINSVLYGIVLLWMSASSEKRDKEWKEHREKKDKEFNANFEKIEKEMKEKVAEWERARQESEKRVIEAEESTKSTHEKFQRVRLILLARLSDYAKELDFWRDTIRKILYENKTDEKIVDKLFDQVSKSLKTYSIQGRQVDFSTIETLAKMINDNKNQ